MSAVAASRRTSRLGLSPRLIRWLRDYSVVGIVVAIVVFETAIYQDQNDVPVGLFHPEYREQTFRLLDLLVPAAILAGLARLTRTSIVETANADFVKTARAKGLGEQRILWGHVLPNALLPMVTFMGIDVGGIFAGAILAESIFNLPGLGQFMFQAIKLKEGGVVVLLSTLAFVSFILINLLVDIIYGAIDPRVRNV